jgi:predicted SAM-dependent methyltransferase
MKTKRKLLRIHLGCGKRNIPGFTNVDLADYKHIDYKRSVDNLSVFKNNSAELIYASHVLEYFDRQEVVEVLKEWYRVLAPKGVLRLAVPDFDKLIKVYRQYKTLDKILGPMYGRMEIKSKQKKKTLYHKTVFDFDSLRKILMSVGFKNVKRYDWQKRIHLNYDDHSQAYVPHMDKKNGILISLNIEANK